MKQLSRCSHRLGDVYDTQPRTASVWREGWLLSCSVAVA
jgi:hypothetical protein